jgi:hypothetical protein
MTNQTLPNLFIVGAAKCATTTMYEMLVNTPGVAMSRRKEPQHFSDDFRSLPNFPRTQNIIRKAYNRHWITDRREYLRNFPRTDARWLGEASTTYLQSRTAAANIHAFNPDARIVISLRNPISRAASDYAMRRFLAQTSHSFSEAIRADHQRALRNELSIFEPYVQSSLYAAQVERYLSHFPREQVLIEVIDRPGIGFSQVPDDLSAFLGLPVSRRAGNGTGKANVRRAVRFPRLNHFLHRHEFAGPISRALPPALKDRLRDLYFGDRETLTVPAEDEAFLRDVFAPDIERLSKLLGQDLSFWLADQPQKSG